MTIDKDDVLVHLNKELNRSETDIDEYRLETLKDLRLQTHFLWIETTVPTIVGRAYYSLPTDYKKLMTIKIDDNKPLGKITWTEYLSLIADQTSDDYNEPSNFAIHGGFWYPHPTPDAIYTATLHYAGFVLESEDGTDAVDDIVFGDIYRSAIYAKTKAVYCRSLGWTDRQAEFEFEYQKILLPLLKDLIEHEPLFVKNHDL